MMSILAVKNGFMSHLCHNFRYDLPALKSLACRTLAVNVIVDLKSIASDFSPRLGKAHRA